MSEKTAKAVTATKMVSIYFHGTQHDLNEEDATSLRDALLGSCLFPTRSKNRHTHGQAS